MPTIRGVDGRLILAKEEERDDHGRWMASTTTATAPTSTASTTTASPSTASTGFAATLHPLAPPAPPTSTPDAPHGPSNPYPPNVWSDDYHGPLAIPDNGYRPGPKTVIGSSRPGLPAPAYIPPATRPIAPVAPTAPPPVPVAPPAAPVAPTPLPLPPLLTGGSSAHPAGAELAGLLHAKADANRPARIEQAGRQQALFFAHRILSDGGSHNQLVQAAHDAARIIARDPTNDYDRGFAKEMIEIANLSASKLGAAGKWTAPPMPAKEHPPIIDPVTGHPYDVVEAE